MSALIDAATRGMSRLFVATLATGLIVWLADRILGRRQP